jgi:hypothetical protein
MRSMEIVTEADRVAGQLNDFINYSRPREVRRAPVAVEPRGRTRSSRPLV